MNFPYKNILLIIVFLSFVNLFSQEPAYFKIGETDFANTQIYTLLYDDNTDIIYAGTNNGLYIYKQNKFTRLDNAKRQKGNAVFSLIQNSKGEVFCINLSGQVFKIVNNSLQLIYESNEKRKSNYFWCYAIENDAILIATDKSIRKIKTDGSIEIIYKGFSIMSSNQTNEGIFFYLTSSKNNKTLKYANNKISFYELKNINPSQIIISYISINNKTFALKTNGDLVNLSNNLTQKFESKSKERVTFLNQKLSIGLDVHKGARYFYSNKNTITTSKTFFKNTFLSCFTKSKKGTLFFGTFGDGIMVIPNYKITKINSTDYLFLDLTTTPENEVAISTRSGEIFTFKNDSLKLIDKVVNNVDNIFYFPNYHFYSKNKFIYTDINKYNIGIKDAAKMNNESLLIATAKGIGIFNKNNKTDNLVVNITTERCNTLTWSKKDSIIYFTSNVGVLKKHLNKPEITELLFDNNSFLASDLAVINNLLICGSTNNGLLIFKEDELVFQLTTKEGLLSNSIKQATLKDDILYILTRKGMQIYDMKKKKFLGLGVNEGIITKYITKFALSNDKLWLLEKHSLSSVNLNTIIKNEEHQIISKLYIDSLQLNNKKINFQKKHTFNHTENKITVFFDYRNIQTKSEAKIMYTLEGFYTKWKSLSTTQNKIEFQSLPTGNYTFKIKASYRNQETKTFSYPFTITPPFWQTWWFYTFLIFLLALIFKIRFKQIKNKNKQLLEKQQLKTNLLDSELKALRSQMNPHFIFNSLNSIQGLILQQNIDASYDYLVLFANLVRSTLNYSNKDFISIHKELEFLDVYLKLEKLRFGDDFTYNINYIGDKEIKVPSLIVQPFIENALLHGLLHKKGNKNITIQFEYTSNLVCTIIDNGIGRVKAKEINQRQGKRYDSFALKAIKQRFKILSAKSGKKAFFTTTDLYNEDIPIGTKIIITMPFKTIF